jgi:ADP-ribosylglycohydrolase
LQAARSAEVTHAHPEGIAGAVAVARVSSYLAAARLRGGTPDAESIIAAAAEGVSGSMVSFGLGRAANRLGAPLDEVVSTLGNGREVLAQDTVPFCVWVVATWPTDYPSAIEACVEARGDIDTTSAIVGGMVAAFTGVGDHDGVRGVPAEWVASREPLPPAARELRKG